jgi:hypothetical protein
MLSTANAAVSWSTAPWTITGDFDASDGAACIMVAYPYQMPWQNTNALPDQADGLPGTFGARASSSARR